MDHERRLKGFPPAVERYLALALPQLLKRPSAAWWIDTRIEPNPLVLALISRTMAELDANEQEAAQAPALAPCPF